VWQCDTVRGSVLQDVAVRCRMLQCVATEIHDAVHSPVAVLQRAYDKVPIIATICLYVDVCTCKSMDVRVCIRIHILYIYVYVPAHTTKFP